MMAGERIALDAGYDADKAVPGRLGQQLLGLVCFLLLPDELG